VVDSRDHGDYIRRRRECLGCGDKQTTYERIEAKRGLLEEEGKKICEYRRLYPKDERSDEKILDCLKEIEENTTSTQLIFGAAYLKGFMK